MKINFYNLPIRNAKIYIIPNIEFTYKFERTSIRWLWYTIHISRKLSDNA